MNREFLMDKGVAVLCLGTGIRVKYNIIMIFDDK